MRLRLLSAWGSPLVPAGSRSGHPQRRWRRFRGGHGVSDVVATILLLSLTVVLFAALFTFVTRFPAPPAQDANQFQASVILGSSGTAITGVRILQDGGPSVPRTDSVYLTSSKIVSDWQFSQSGGVPVAWGTNNASGGWNFGQYWTTTFKTTIAVPANITIFIVSQTTLLYQTVVPGGGPNVAPLLTSTYTVPAVPAVGSAFQIVALVSGNTSGLALNVSLAEIPGLPTSVQTMHPYGTGEWVYNASGTTTTAGTYLAFIQGVNSTGGTVSGEVTVTLSGPSSGGGGGSSGVSVTTGISPLQQPVPQGPSSASYYLWATVTYTGSMTKVPVYVNFTVSQVPVGRVTPTAFNTTVTGQTGTTVSGPGSVTVYSKTAFGAWLLNSTITLLAQAHLVGVGTGNGTDTFASPPAPQVNGLVYLTTSSTGAFPSENSFSHTCTASTCPYLFVSVWDNFTAAEAGPTTVNVTGTVTTNASCTSCQATYTVGSTKITLGTTCAGGAAGQSCTSTSPVTPSGNRWTPPGGSHLVANTVFTIRLWLTVTAFNGNTQIIGYIYDTFTATAT